MLTNQAREAETLLLQQSRVTTELQDGLMRTRMVPFSRHAQRLRRVVRQTADEDGKQVDLKFIGAEGEMDRQVLERVLAPLEHMLRNSVIHGIEDAKTRKQRKKPAGGTISIALHREGSEVVMEVMDDGGGLNIKAIRKKAEELGMTSKEARLSERDIMQFILEPGFSTAAKVTQSAGRGVGMDVVANEIKQFAGTLRMDSTEGQGAKFTVRLPFTLSITQALLVRVAEQPYAVPLPAIEAIARIPRMQLEQLMASENPVYMYGGRQYRLQHLSVLLGIGAPQFPEDLTAIPLLLVRSGDSLHRPHHRRHAGQPRGGGEIRRPPGEQHPRPLRRHHPGRRHHPPDPGRDSPWRAASPCRKPSRSWWRSARPRRKTCAPSPWWWTIPSPCAA